jgi:hypothetical protein
MDDMKLPEGKTCSDCRSWARCKKFIGSLTGKETTCDWAPSRFEESNESLMKRIESLITTIESQKKDIDRIDYWMKFYKGQSEHHEREAMNYQSELTKAMQENENSSELIESQKEEIERLQKGIKRLGDRFHENDPIAPSEFYELVDGNIQEIETCIDCSDGILLGKDEGGRFCDSCGTRETKSAFHYMGIDLTIEAKSIYEAWNWEMLEAQMESEYDRGAFRELVKMYENLVDNAESQKAITELAVKGLEQFANRGSWTEVQHIESLKDYAVWTGGTNEPWIDAKTTLSEIERLSHE